MTARPPRPRGRVTKSRFESPLVNPFLIEKFLRVLRAMDDAENLDTARVRLVEDQVFFKSRTDAKRASSRWPTDFSAATSTKPSKAGTALPATCSIGETFFKTDATTGANLYGCSRADLQALDGDMAPAAPADPKAFFVYGDYLKRREWCEQIMSTVEWIAMRLVLMFPIVKGCWDFVHWLVRG